MNAVLDQCTERTAPDSATAPFAAALAVSAAMGAALSERNWEHFMTLVDQRDNALRQVLVQPPHTVSESDRQVLLELERQNRLYLREARNARATLAAEIKRIQTARAATGHYRDNEPRIGVLATCHEQPNT